MSNEPTRAQLTQQKAAAECLVSNLEKQLNNIDDEARAYDICVRALKGMTVSDSYQRGQRPDREKIGRVLSAVQARFGIGEAVVSDNSFEQWSPGLESQVDPRDIVITQLIDALRKS